MSYKKRGEGVVRLADGAFIPADPLNADWRDYLVWLAKGNTPQAERTLTEVREAALKRMQEARDAAMAAGFTFEGHVYHSDKDAIRDVQMALSGAQMAGEGDELPSTIPWKLLVREGATTHIPLNLQQLGALFKGLTGNMLAVYGREEARMAEILSAPTEAAVEAVRW